MSWRKVKLGEFLINRENRFKPNDINISGLKRIDKIDFSGKIHLSDKPTKTDMILVKSGDLVISGINVEKGAMSIYRGIKDVIATIHYSSYSFDDKKIDIDFLKMFLKSPEFKRAIKEQVPGGIKTEIKPKHLLPLEVVIPDNIMEQKEVVKHFSKLENQNLQLDTELIYQQDLIKQLREAFLQEAMQGKLTKQSKQDGSAIELLEKIKEEKEKLIDEKIIRKEKGFLPIKAEEIPFDIPENWVWCKLSEVCLKITDGTHNSPPNYEKGDFKYVTAKNIKDIGIDLSKITYVSNEVHKEIFARCNPEKGDILYIKDGATTGIVTINNLEEPFSMLSSVALLKPSFFIENKFLMYALRSPFYYKATRKDMSGVAITRVTLEKIQRAIIPLPPIQEQKRIVKKLEELMNLSDGLIESINQSKIEIERLIKTLLNEALGVATTYEIEKEKTLKHNTSNMQIHGTILVRRNMKIIEILQSSQEPISATFVWGDSEYYDDIEAFYAELKRLIDIEKLVVEEKRGMESFLKLAPHEN